MSPVLSFSGVSNANDSKAVAAAFVTQGAASKGVTAALRQHYSDKVWLQEFGNAVIEIVQPKASSELGGLATALKRAAPKNEDGELLAEVLTFKLSKAKTLYGKGAITAIVIPAPIKVKNDAEAAKQIAAIEVLAKEHAENQTLTLALYNMLELVECSGKLESKKDLMLSAMLQHMTAMEASESSEENAENAEAEAEAEAA